MLEAMPSAWNGITVASLTWENAGFGMKTKTCFSIAMSFVTIASKAKRLLVTGSLTITGKSGTGVKGSSIVITNRRGKNMDIARYGRWLKKSIFCIIRLLGGFGMVQNTPTGCGNNLPHF